MRRTLAFGLFLTVASGSLSVYADDKPFGLAKRLPWNDSKVVGSPDPLPPYKVVRAYPHLNIKQPLTLSPEPGTDRLFILQHLNYWAGPGRLLAAADRQDVAETETLLDIDSQRSASDRPYREADSDKHRASPFHHGSGGQAKRKRGGFLSELFD